MASAGFERAEQARFDCKAHLLKVPKNGIGSQGHVTFNVLEETPFGIKLPNDAADVGPEVAWIVFASPVTGKAERLTGISASEDMNLSAPWASVEGGNVTPERRLIQGLVFHPCHESGCREGFPLDVTNSSITELGNMEAEFEPSDAGAEGNSIKAIISGGM
jgi:hypothetical protein